MLAKYIRTGNTPWSNEVVAPVSQREKMVSWAAYDNRRIRMFTTW